MDAVDAALLRWAKGRGIVTHPGRRNVGRRPWIRMGKDRRTKQIGIPGLVNIQIENCHRNS